HDSQAERVGNTLGYARRPLVQQLWRLAAQNRYVRRGRDSENGERVSRAGSESSDLVAAARRGGREVQIWRSQVRLVGCGEGTSRLAGAGRKRQTGADDPQFGYALSSSTRGARILQTAAGTIYTRMG